MQNDYWASILACQGMLSIVEPLLVCVPIEILTSCEGIHIHQWVIDYTGLYWNMWPAPFVTLVQQSALPQRLRNVSIFLWNPSAKLEMNCAFTHAPINCICNIDLLRSKFHVTILYSLSLMIFVQRVGVFGKFIQYTMHILSSIPSLYIISLMYFESLSFSLLLFTYQYNDYF